jgi:hypothetical protein
MLLLQKSAKSALKKFMNTVTTFTQEQIFTNEKLGVRSDCLFIVVPLLPPLR